MSLLKFEWKKIHQAKLPYYLLAFTLLAITLLFVRNVWQQPQVISDQVTYFSEFSSDLRMELEGDREALKAGANPVLEDKIASGSTLYSKLGELTTNLQAGKRVEALTNEVSVYDLAGVYKAKEGTFALSESDMEAEKALNKELLALQLPKEDISRSILPSAFTYFVMKMLLSGFGILFVLLTVIGFVTREYEEKSIRLAYTLPIKRVHYLLVKLGLFVGIGVAWVAISTVYAYTISTMFGTPLENQFQYPLLSNGETWVTIQDMVQRFSWIGLLVLIATLTIGWAIAVSTRSTLVGYTVAIAVVGGGSYLALDGRVAAWNPLQLFNVPQALLALPSTSTTIPLLSVVLIAGLMVAVVQWNKKRSV